MTVVYRAEHDLRHCDITPPSGDFPELPKALATRLPATGFNLRDRSTWVTHDAYRDHTACLLQGSQSTRSLKYAVFNQLFAMHLDFFNMPLIS